MRRLSLYVAAFLFVGGAGGAAGGAIVWLMSDRGPLETNDKFDVFVYALATLLAIFGVLLTAVGIYSYQTLRSLLSAQAGQSIEELAKQAREEEESWRRGVLETEDKYREQQRHISDAILAYQFSYKYWQEYEGLWRIAGWEDLHDEVRWASRQDQRQRIWLLIDLAIPPAEQALDYAEKALDISASDRAARVRASAKNMLAYHLATRRDAQRSEEAKKHAREALSAAPRNYGYWHRLETLAWVYLRLKDSPDDHHEGLRAITQVLMQQETGQREPGWREGIREKYAASFPDLNLPNVGVPPNRVDT